MRRLHRRNRVPRDELTVLDMPLLGGFESGVLVQDHSQGNNTGTAAGGTGTPVPVYPGFDFTAASTHRISDTTALLNAFPFTILGWFKTSSNGIISAASLYDKDADDDYAVLGESAAQVGASIARETGQTRKIVALTTASNDGVWHQYAGVFASNISRTIYRDGAAESAIGTDDRDPTAVIDAWSIGSRQSSTPAWFFNGSISGVIIIKKVLSVEEIQSIYNVTKFRYEVAA